MYDINAVLMISLKKNTENQEERDYQWSGINSSMIYRSLDVQELCDMFATWL